MIKSIRAISKMQTQLEMPSELHLDPGSATSREIYDSPIVETVLAYSAEVLVVVHSADNFAAEIGVVAQIHWSAGPARLADSAALQNSVAAENFANSEH